MVSDDPKPLVILQPGFDLPAIEAVLRESRIIVSPADFSLFDPYQPGDYIVQRKLHGNKSVFLLDLNALIRIASALDPLNKPGESERAVAALMALANLADVLLEPVWALHEPLAENGPKDYYERLAALRKVQNVSPRHWARIALGEQHYLPKSVLPRGLSAKFPPPQEDRQRRVELNYLAALKIASVALQASDTQKITVEAFEAFLRWSFESFVFIGPALMYGSLFFSPNRKRGMFKALRANDPEAVLRGVRNAARDMTLCSAWMKDVKDTRAVFLVSLDEALRDVAGDLVRVGPEVPGEDPLLARLRRDWGPTTGERCFQVYSELVSAKDDPKRRKPKLDDSAYFKSLHDSLVEEVTSAAQRT